MQALVVEFIIKPAFVEAFEEVERSGQGVAVVDGKIVENLHVETAKKVLAMASAIASL